MAKRPALLASVSPGEGSFLADVLRQETVGGALMLAAATAGLIAANTGLADSYESLKHTMFGPDALHLHLSLEAWAADGLLAIFFFVAGLELKRELGRQFELGQPGCSAGRRGVGRDGRPGRGVPRGCTWG